LIAGTLLFWVLAAVPVHLLGGGDLTWVHSGTAVLLCLVPAAATLVWAGWSAGQDPQQMTLTVLGSSGVRMFAVLFIALLLYSQAPWFRGQDGFLFWLLAVYLFVLAVEIVLLVRWQHERVS
jgi:hypothetical protein